MEVKNKVNTFPSIIVTKTDFFCFIHQIRLLLIFLLEFKIFQKFLHKETIFSLPITKY